MNKNNMIKRIKSTKTGRFLCRIIGEDTGAVMMEYVLVALLIAAASIAAVFYFGRNTQKTYNVISEAVTGNDTKAITDLEKAHDETPKMSEAAIDQAKKHANTTPGL